MSSLNAPVTPGHNSIMIVAMKLSFHQGPQTEGRKAIISLIFLDIALLITL
jgi:hypothetical protein